MTILRRGRVGIGICAVAFVVATATTTFHIDLSSAVPQPDGGPDGGPPLEESLPAWPQFDSLKGGGWRGEPSGIVGVGTVDQREYIIVDYPFDDRGADVEFLTPDFADHTTRSVYSGPELPYAGKKAPQGVSGDYSYPSGQVVGSADIVEVRIAQDAESWYLLVCLNALDDPARTGLAITIDDRNLTVGGSSAEFEGQSVELRTDTSANVFEIRVPRVLFDPGSGKHRIFVGSGLWDVETQTWFQPPAQITIPIPLFDVAYISDEIFGQTTNSYERSYWNELKQSTYISQGSIPIGAFTVDFSQLMSQCTTECVELEPYDGLSIRVMRSSQTIDEGVIPDERYGDSRDTGYRIYGSVFQPYAIYAPTDFANAHSLVVLLHPEGGNYMSYFLTGWPSMRAWADELDAIVVIPFGRGEAGRFAGESEKDIFEVWRDVAQHHVVDPERVYLMGLGAGGEAAVRIANLYPDQFARVIAWGAPFASLKDSVTCENQGNDCRQTAMDLFGNTVSLPMLLSYGSMDAEAPLPGPNVWLKRLDGKDVPYRFVTYGARSGNASLVGTDKSLILGWLGGRPARARSPSHINYTIIRKFLQEGTDGPNTLYWLRDIRLASTAREGGIQAKLTTDPLVGTRIGPEVGLDGFDIYLAQARTLSDPDKARNVLLINLSNVAYLGVSTRRIGWDTESDGSLRGTSNRECDVLLEGVFPANARAEGVGYEIRSNGMLLHLPAGEFSAEIVPGP